LSEWFRSPKFQSDSKRWIREKAAMTLSRLELGS
jgi:hypothetical protein